MHSAHAPHDRLPRLNALNRYSHHQRYYRRGYPLLSGLLVVAVLVGLSLPYVYLPVGIEAPFVLETTSPATTLRLPQGGRVTYLALADQRTVAAGDTLLILTDEEVSQASHPLRLQERELLATTADLQLLLDPGTNLATGTLPLTTPLLQRELLEYQSGVAAARLTFDHATDQLSRASELHAGGSLATAELETAQLEYDLARNALERLHHQRRQLWQTDLRQQRRELLSLRSDLRALHLRARQLVLTAPHAGTLRTRHSLSVGAYLNANESVAELRPRDTLRARLFVRAADVGLVRPELPVQLQLAAFPHLDWGSVPATLRSCSTAAGDHPDEIGFVALATLNADTLRLPGGPTGTLQPGMTGRAHVVTTRRSLWQLLRDRRQDWLASNN